MPSHWAEASRGLQQELGQAVRPETMRGLRRKQPHRHLLIAGRQFLFLFTAAAVLAWSDAPWLVVPAALLAGLTVFNFTVLLHEELHGLIFPQRRPLASALLGHLYAFWSGISRSQFTRWHLDHHAELGSTEEDPKRRHLSPKRNSRLVKLAYFTPALFVIYFRAASRETAGYPLELQRRISRERLATSAGHLAIQALLLLTGSPALWLKVYVLPVFVVFPVAFAVNRIGQHYNITPDDPLGWTTWVKGHPLWDFLFLKSNYHLEHHLFPSVPFYNLPALQRELTPLFHRHGLEPYNYPGLLWGYLVRNRPPHTSWEQVEAGGRPGNGNKAGQPATA